MIVNGRYIYIYAHTQSLCPAKINHFESHSLVFTHWGPLGSACTALTTHTRSPITRVGPNRTCKNTSTVFGNSRSYSSLFDCVRFLADHVQTVFACSTLQTQVQFPAEAVPFALFGQFCYLTPLLTEHFLCFPFLTCMYLHYINKLVVMIVEIFFALTRVTYGSSWLDTGLAPKPFLFLPLKIGSCVLNSSRAAECPPVWFIMSNSKFPYTWFTVGLLTTKVLQLLLITRRPNN